MRLRHGRLLLALASGTIILTLTVGSALAQSATSARATATFGDGIHRVGKDVRPGTYRSPGGSGCYWARLRSFSGSLNAIIANANASGPTIVTIKPGDKGFESSGCNLWTSTLRQITKKKTRFGSGTFIVGTDIRPGTYRSRGGSGCYWERLNAFTGELSAIIANGNASGQVIVTISSGDRGFGSSGCGVWKRI